MILADFRAQYTQFSSAILYPDATINIWYSVATKYISEEDSACGGLTGDVKDLALSLLTAHLLALPGSQQAGALVSSSIGDVSNTFQVPESRSSFEYWLNGSGYGQQLLALLSFQSAGGWSVGGGPESGSFRKAGGAW